MSDGKKLTLIDPFRIRSRSQPVKRPAADLTMDIWRAGRLHRQMKESYSQALETDRKAREAYETATRSRLKVWSALAAFEAELLELYETSGMTDFSEFVTKECGDE